MGFWGTKLFNNDVAVDTKNAYLEAIAQSGDLEMLTQKMLDDFSVELSDYDDAPLIWLALADTQLSTGAVHPTVKESAMKVINQAHLAKKEGAMSDNSISDSVTSLSASYLEKLKKKLEAPRGADSIKVPKKRGYTCDWDMWSVYALPIENVDPTSELFGKYMILRKTAVGQSEEKHICPVVTMQISSFNNVPRTLEELEKCPYVRVSVSAKWNGLEIVDLGGYYYEFEISATSKRSVPNDKLIYIGVFPEYKLPNDSIKKNGRVFSVYWKFLEEVMLERYLDLKEL
jgi:hypothetical protein